MEEKLMKDSTRVKLLNGIEKDIPYLNEYLWNKILPCKDDKNYLDFKSEYDIVLIFTVVYLDFLVCFKNLLSSQLFWENAVAFKNICKIIHESHSKISGKVFFQKKTELVDYKKTEGFERDSLWFGKISTIINDDNKSDYFRISKLLYEFKGNRKSLKYINKIRDFDGHYSNLDDYMSEIKSIDMDTIFKIANDWFVIMRDVYLFASDLLKNKLDVSK